MGGKATDASGSLACGFVSTPDTGEPAWADRRLSFGSTADTYDRFRPGYPPDAAAWLVGAEPPARVLDLGAGTGRLAGVLAGLGYDVVAVEPDDGMRAVAEQALPGRTLRGSAEAIPVDDASVDAVVAGQAFHWFDPERALPEIARVVRPGGHLGVIWNVRDEREAWSQRLSELVGGEDRRAAEGRGRAPGFGPSFGAAQSLVVEHEQELDADRLVGLAASWSYVFLRPDRDEVLAQVRAIATGSPELAGRSTFTLAYEARCFRARRLAAQDRDASTLRS
jgi:SAM-dependent methyltransferase